MTSLDDLDAIRRHLLDALNVVEERMLHVVGSGMLSAVSAAPAVTGSRLARYVVEYIDESRARWSENHRVYATTVLRSLAEAASDGRLLLTREDLARWRDALAEEGRCPATVNRWLSTAGTFLEWMRREHGSEIRQRSEPGYQIPTVKGLKLRDSRPAREVRKAVPLELLPHVLGREFIMMMNEAQARWRGEVHHSQRWLPLLMLFTGARPEELAGLTRGDVELWSARSDGGWAKGFVIRIEGGKTAAAERMIPVPNVLREAFSRVIPPPDRPSSFLFPALAGRQRRKAMPVSRWFNQRWLPSVAHQGAEGHPAVPPEGAFEGLVLYSLRHTYASILRKGGLEEPMIAQLLGHSQRGVTGRYAGQYSIEQLAKAVDGAFEHVGVGFDKSLGVTFKGS